MCQKKQDDFLSVEAAWSRSGEAFWKRLGFFFLWKNRLRLIKIFSKLGLGIGLGVSQKTNVLLTLCQTWF